MGIGKGTAALLTISMLLASGCSTGLKEGKSLTDKPAAALTDTGKKGKEAKEGKEELIQPEGITVEQRFKTPKGFERVPVIKGSFPEYLRNVKLKPHGSKVLFYNGKEKDKSGVYEAVADIPIGDRDLHQCADAVMLLRAQYLYDQKRYADIHFNFVSGFKAEYSKWMEGYRIQVSGNKAVWVQSAQPSNNQQTFRKFMDIVFSYAGSLSLEKELKPVNRVDMKPGDVFIVGGSPGHAIIVMDMATNKQTGEKLFMLAQSYMPAQETQILSNPQNQDLGPWYVLKEKGELQTPEWTFGENTLRRFD